MPWRPYPQIDDYFFSNCRLLNQEEMSRSAAHYGAKRIDPPPTAQLELELPGFDLDMFQWEGRLFASEQLRKAMGLDEANVSYFDIDDRSSAQSVQSKRYNIMEVAVFEELFDGERFIKETGGAPGSVHEHLHLSARLNITRDIFHDFFLVNYVYCTDALALRVLTAGCTGVTFLDPLQFGSLGVGRRFRTLRGVEKLVAWDDSVEGGERTEVVELIH